LRLALAAHAESMASQRQALQGTAKHDSRVIKKALVRASSRLVAIARDDGRRRRRMEGAIAEACLRSEELKRQAAEVQELVAHLG